LVETAQVRARDLDLSEGVGQFGGRGFHRPPGQALRPEHNQFRFGGPGHDGSLHTLDGVASASRTLRREWCSVRATARTLAPSRCNRRIRP
jgi:hypothetical protein